MTEEVFYLLHNFDNEYCIKRVLLRKELLQMKNQDALIFVKLNYRYRFYDCGEFDEVNKLGYNQRTK